MESPPIPPPQPPAPPMEPIRKKTLRCRVFGCRFIAIQQDGAIEGIPTFHVRFTFRCKRCGSTTISSKKKLRIDFKWRT